MSATEPERPRVLQMRLLVEAPDHVAAVAFYRDELGAREELAPTHSSTTHQPEGERP